MARIETDDLIEALVDDGSWRSWDVPLDEPSIPPQSVIDLARENAGRDEAVTSGSARVGGEPVAIVAGDFRFLAGSVGRAAALRIVSAFDRAATLGLPVLGLPISGGTRVQEGTPAFLLMAAIAAAVRRHQDCGLPYLVYLRHPTAGGVFATLGSLGDVTHAQPGALVGFLGPRVYEGIYGEPFPEGVQTAEGLARAGVIDGVAEVPEWRDTLSRILVDWDTRVAADLPPGWEPAGAATHLHRTATPAARRRAAGMTGWAAVKRTRAQDRPGVRDLMRHGTGTVLLSGTGQGERAVATVLAIMRIDGLGCVLIGQDRVAQAERSAKSPNLGIGPGDLRVARRGMRLAERWGLPLVTVIDTQGGELSAAAENGAMAGEVGRCLSDLSALRTATMSLLLGGGSGGAALALLPTDRVVAAADSWVTPLPPEGASVIIRRTTDGAADMADSQHITAADLLAIGAVDRIVASPADDLDEVAAAVGEELVRLAAVPVDLGARAGKWADLLTRIPE